MKILRFNSPANEEMILPIKLDSMIAANTSTTRGHHVNIITTIVLNQNFLAINHL